MPEAKYARADMLERIRAAKPHSSRVDIESAWETIARDYKAAPELPREEMLQLLEDRLMEYDAQVFSCSRDRIEDLIAQALRQRGIRSLVIPAGLPRAWLPEGFGFAEDRGLNPGELNQFDGVLTAATLAIADTGTIVLQNAPGQGRRAATLVPDYHLCVLFANQVVQSVPQAMRLLQATATLPTTLISGPSATADIEMTRIKGVHGPRFLDVILVRE